MFDVIVLNTTNLRNYFELIVKQNGQAFWA